jgi:hypothetical protein
MVALDLSKHTFMRRVRRFRNSRIANELGDVADLLPEEQSELALKLRYGIGMDQLNAIADRAPSMSPKPRRFEPPRNRPEIPDSSPRSDSDIRTRAATLGLSAGSRGQWLRR